MMPLRVTSIIFQNQRKFNIISREMTAVHFSVHILIQLNLLSGWGVLWRHSGEQSDCLCGWDESAQCKIFLVIQGKKERSQKSFLLQYFTVMMNLLMTRLSHYKSSTPPIYNIKVIKTLLSDQFVHNAKWTSVLDFNQPLHMFLSKVLWFDIYFICCTIIGVFGRSPQEAMPPP